MKFILKFNLINQIIIYLNILHLMYQIYFYIIYVKINPFYLKGLDKKRCEKT